MDKRIEADVELCTAARRGLSARDQEFGAALAAVQTRAQDVLLRTRRAAEGAENGRISENYACGMEGNWADLAQVCQTAYGKGRVLLRWIRDNRGPHMDKEERARWVAMEHSCREQCQRLKEVADHVEDFATDDGLATRDRLLEANGLARAVKGIFRVLHVAQTGGEEWAQPFRESVDLLLQLAGIGHAPDPATARH